LQWLNSWPGDVVGTHLSGTDDFRQVAYRSPILLVMGSEGAGLSPELTAACTRLVKIPMAGRLDSLNLAVATALALYQIRGPHLSL
jgi:TrmH family RNA methyltransferase